MRSLYVKKVTFINEVWRRDAPARQQKRAAETGVEPQVLLKIKKQKTKGKRKCEWMLDWQVDSHSRFSVLKSRLVTLRLS
jgi:hypothetical protein